MIPISGGATAAGLIEIENPPACTPADDLGSEETQTMAAATKTKLNVHPLDDRILLERGEAEETTAGGIVLPDAAREKPQRGTVRATGPGKLLDSGERGKLSVEVGDEVFYGKYAGTEVDIDGDTYVILKENDILAIVER